MAAGKSFHIEISGKEGMFTVDKRVSFFHEHTCSKGFKDDMKTVKALIQKLVKNDSVMVTLSKFGSDYQHKSIVRYCFNQWAVDGLFELEIRQFTGYDFSNIKRVNFQSMSALFKYLVENMTEIGLKTLDEIPTTTSWFQQELAKS